MLKVTSKGKVCEVEVKTAGGDNIYIPPKIWDNNLHNIKTTDTAYNTLTKVDRADYPLPYLRDIALRIDDIYHRTKMYLMSTDMSGLTVVQMRDTIKHTLGYSGSSKRAVADNSDTILDYYDYFLESKVREDNVSQATIKQYERMRSVIEAQYQDTRFSDITDVWVDKLKVFLRDSQCFKYVYRGVEKEYKQEALSVVASNNILKNLKNMLSHAYKHGKTQVNVADRITKRKNVEVDAKATDIYLTKDEIVGLHNYTPQDTTMVISGKNTKVSAKTLSVARDLFVLCCVLGQRVSDIEGGFSPERVLSQMTDSGTIRYIDITQKKTNTKVSVLLSSSLFGDIAEQIFARYDNNVPAMSGQKINIYIKEVVRQLGLSRTHTYQEEKGGVITEHTKPIYELITSHIGRRSFVSNAIICGYSSDDIMTMTGHSSKDMVDLYNKLSTLHRTLNAFKVK